MRRAYVVVGAAQENTSVPVVWYAIAHSMIRADELCCEAEAADPHHIYMWYEVIEEGD